MLTILDKNRLKCILVYGQFGPRKLNNNQINPCAGILYILIIGIE